MNKSKFIHILFAGNFRISFISLFLLGALNLRAQSINDFVTRWDLSKTGSAVSGGLTSITFNTTNTSGSISYTWRAISPATGSGSGTFATGTDATRTITGLPANATIELRISPTNLQRFYINNGTDRSRLTDVTQWGTTAWTSMESMFYGCNNLNITATDLPNLSSATSMSQMFFGCSILNGPANINNWNTSNVTNMSGLFSSAFSFNQNIGSWNTGNVATMRDMFSSASSFNHNLGNWILNSAVSLEMMFDNCGMSCDNYSKTLTGWSLSSTATGRTLGASGRSYGTNVTSLRSNLTTATPTGKGWSISDGGVAAGTCGPNVYYSKSSGNLDVLATWGTNTDGTGTSPTDFITANQIFVIRNRSTVSLGGNWAVSGTDSYIVLGDGTSAITFSTGVNTVSGAYRLTNNTNLEIATDPSGLSLICESGSTVNYNGAGSQTIAPGQYHHLTLSNNRASGTITLGSGIISVRGNMINTLSNVGSWVNTGNTFVYAGTGAQTIAALEYNHLIIAGTRIATPAITLASGNIKIAGDCTNGISGSVTWVNSGNTIDYNGTGNQKISSLNYNNLTISGIKNNSIITLQSSETIGIAGTFSLTATGTYTLANTGSTVRYNGTGSQTICAMNYHNIEISGLRTGSATITLPNARIIGIAGNFSITATGTYSIVSTGSSVIYDGIGAQTIWPMNYFNLNISGTKTGTPDITLPSSGIIGVAGNFSLTATGNYTIINTGSTIEYNGTGTQTIDAFNYFNLTISGARTSSSTISLQSSGIISIAGIFSFTATGNYSMAVTGSTVKYNGTNSQTICAINYHNLDISGTRSGSAEIILPSSGTIGIAKNMVVSATGSYMLINSGCTFNYNGTGTQFLGAINYNNLIISGNKNNNDITLQSGTIGVSGTLTVTSTNIRNWLTFGNTIEYNGSGPQNIVSAIPYQNLSIAGNNTKTLDGNTSVVENLTLSNKLTLGNFNLNLGGNANGGNSNNYVQTSGTGSLNKNILRFSNFHFPVGNSSYNPVNIMNNTSASDEFSVRILDEIYDGGTSGSVVTKPRIKRTWLINKSTPTANSGTGVNFTFYWNIGENYMVNTPALFHFDGSTWQKQTGTTSSTSTSLTYTGYMGSFSPFSIGDDIVLLPVNWLHFHCESGKNQSNQIHWSITGENNKPTFWIERSAEGITYHTIGKIHDSEYGHNLRHYSFTDAKPLDEINYYRVRTVDDDGYTSYSSVCMQKNQPILKNGIFKISPNPTSGMCTLMAPESDFQFMWEVFSSSGKLVTKGSSHAGKAALHLQTLSDGVYQVKVTGEGFAENHKLLIQH